MPRLAPGERLCLTYSVDRLSLLDGVWRVDAAAVSSSTGATYEWVHRAAHFSVTDVIGRSGMVQLGGAWEPARPAGRPGGERE
jgi:hypothetical protein